MADPIRHDDGTYSCPSCARVLVPTPGLMHYRGRDFAALFCASCNSMWDNPDDSMLGYAEQCARTPGTP